MNLAIRVSPLVLSSTAALLLGCGSSPSPGSSSGSTPLATGGATSIYVVENTPSGGTSNSILQFNASSNGSVSPVATLLPPSTMFVDSVATDGSGQIYVGGSIGIQNEILVYASGATGSAAPVRTITESAGNSFTPTAITIDSAGLVYVAGFGTQLGTIAVFSATANGFSTPIRMIQGSLTQLTSPNGISVDASGDVYVANSVFSSTTASGLITIFAPGATGNVAPARVISNTTILEGIATDASGNVYTIGDTATNVSGVEVTSCGILEFSNSASGAATPTNTISGAATALTFGGGVSRDSAGNLYVVNANVSGASATFNMLGFSPTAHGNVAPSINISSSAWTDAGSQIALK